MSTSTFHWLLPSHCVPDPRTSPPLSFPTRGPAPSLLPCLLYHSHLASQSLPQPSSLSNSQSDSCRVRHFGPSASPPTQSRARSLPARRPLHDLTPATAVLARSPFLFAHGSQQSARTHKRTSRVFPPPFAAVLLVI